MNSELAGHWVPGGLMTTSILPAPSITITSRDIGAAPLTYDTNESNTNPTTRATHPARPSDCHSIVINGPHDGTERPASAAAAGGGGGGGSDGVRGTAQRQIRPPLDLCPTRTARRLRHECRHAVTVIPSSRTAITEPPGTALQ